jgi:hypothetical protein
MKKRAMKKWIPKESEYCHGCRWRAIRKKKLNDMNIPEHYCLYMNKGDSDIDCSLLWDGCKECGVHLSTDKTFHRECKRLHRYFNKAKLEDRLIF